jgi:hypothetical protein
MIYDDDGSRGLTYSRNNDVPMAPYFSGSRNVIVEPFDEVDEKCHHRIRPFGQSYNECMSMWRKESRLSRQELNHYPYYYMTARGIPNHDGSVSRNMPSDDPNGVNNYESRSFGDKSRAKPETSTLNTYYLRRRNQGKNNG